MKIGTALLMAGGLDLPFPVPPPDASGKRFDDLKKALMQIVMGSLTPNRALQLNLKLREFDPKTSLVTDLGEDGGQNLRNGPEYGTINRCMGNYASNMVSNLHKALFDGDMLKKVMCT